MALIRGRHQDRSQALRALDSNAVSTVPRLKQSCQVSSKDPPKLTCRPGLGSLCCCCVRGSLSLCLLFHGGGALTVLESSLVPIPDLQDLVWAPDGPLRLLPYWIWFCHLAVRHSVPWHTAETAGPGELELGGRGRRSKFFAACGTARCISSLNPAGQVGLVSHYLQGG